MKLFFRSSINSRILKIFFFAVIMKMVIIWNINLLQKMKWIQLNLLKILNQKNFLI